MKFYLDFEATQFSNQIISIGCVSDNSMSFNTLVKPTKGKINNFITGLTGITMEDVETAPTADEAFLSFYDYCKLETRDFAVMPKFYCYGNSDTDFLRDTIKTMTNFKAIMFATTIANNLIDYSRDVKQYFGMVHPLALKKVVALIEKEQEIEQKHNALEDALMLREVVSHLDEITESREMLKTFFPNNFKTTNQNNNNNSNNITVKPLWNKNRKKAPKFVQEWQEKNKFDVCTFADESNYVVKCWIEDQEDYVKYFDSQETACIWTNFFLKNTSTKRAYEVNLTNKNIMKASRKKTTYCNFYWEVKENDTTIEI